MKRNYGTSSVLILKAFFKAGSGLRDRETQRKEEDNERGKNGKARPKYM
jgi:hypothetical protein